MELTIRAVITADLTTIHRIETGIYPDPWPRSIFYLMRGRAPDLFLVADDEGEVVGYAVGEIEWRNSVSVGHVMNIAVEETHRQHGLAGRLMDELESRFKERDADSAYLEVRASNFSAQSLYRKRGYRESGVLPRYYKDEDGLVMEKLLA